MAVNVSGRQIHLTDLCETVRMALASSGLAPSCLELELTESQLMQNAEGIIGLLVRLKEMGVKLSVDDFGTGYSSLAYLKRFPIDCLKVDQAFVRDIIADANDVSITRAIITLAHNLQLKVVAEGVETEGQLGLLIANHCDEVQGYYFSRPLPVDEATALLQTGRSLDSQMMVGMKRGRTLLLVDDEASVLSSLTRLLRRDGYTILTASGAEQGLELLAIHPVDVVVSDQRMPGMSGVEFLRRIKTLHPETVRLVLSGYTDLQAVTDAVNEGAIYKFLTKPWDDDILRANIKEAFLKKAIADENRRAVPPALLEETGAIQSVIDVIPVAIFAKDSASRFVLMNKVCESQWGMSYTDLRGTDGSQVFPADQMGIFLAKDREIFERGYLLDYEEKFWNAELKQNRFGHTFKKPVFDAVGNPLYLVCVTVDITDRRMAVDKLLLSEEKLRTLFDMLPLGIARNSMEGVFVEANASFLNIVGYSLEELNRISYWDLTPASYADQEAQQLESLKSTSRYGPYEKEYINNLGRRVPVRLNGVLITGSDGEQYIWSIVEDISQLKRLDNQLRIAAAAFESQEAMMITDTRSVILRVNRAFTEITGYSAEEAVGQTPSLLKSGRHNADFYKAMWETINATGGWQGEIWDRRKNGEEYPKWLTISVVKNDLGAVSHYIGAHYDITNRKKAEDKINELAFYDPLTGLPNRTLLLDRLKQNMIASSRNDSYGSLLFIDLDNFKALNDTLGHDMGDLLLKQVAQRLTKGVRAGDTVARQGGDEFVVMLVGLGLNQGDAATLTETIGEKILSLLDQPYQLNLVPYRSTASIGATLFSGDLTTIDELMKQADLAMYKSKAAGRNALHFFDPYMESDINEHAVRIDELRLAIEEQQFVLHYQPQVLEDGRVTGAEALVRWQHAEYGLVYPDNFIPLSEETGLILPLGRWVLETACDQLAVWAERPAMAHLTLSVNVSARQLHQPDFAAQVLTVLENSGANPKRLKLELTESLLVSNIEEVITTMKTLQEKGISFSLDDFGTGYSSLSYLKRLPLNQLKIDRSFVKDILIDSNDSSIAKMVVALGENLGLDVIAEGVETEEQRDSLERQGCHAFQGYLFSCPLPLEAFEAFVTRN